MPRPISPSTDPDNHTFSGIRIESLETEGALQYEGSDVAVGDVITDVTKLVFKPDANEHASPYATFTFSVLDSSGAYSDDTYTMTINVNSVQDSPTGGNEEVATDEDTDYTFAESDFTFSDVEGDTFSGIRIESLETEGNLQYEGSDVEIGDIITDLTQLIFSPDSDENGTPYATFTFKLIDSAGTYSDDTYTMTINVNPVPDNPTGANGNVTTDEDVDYTFNVNDFTFNDMDGDTFAGITNCIIGDGWRPAVCRE